MISKYFVFATLLLLTLSSTPTVLASGSIKTCTVNNATVPPIITCPGIDTHGPLLSAVSWSYVSTASLKGALTAGNIQMVEWTFAVGTYKSLATCKTCQEQGTTNYGFDGIAFNTLRPYVNDAKFRQAIEYLTDYATMGTTVLGAGKAGAASPDYFPTGLYGLFGFNVESWVGSPTYDFSFNLVSAANSLLAAGLVVNIGGRLYCNTGNTAETGETAMAVGCGTFTFTTTASLKGIKGWYMHENGNVGGMIGYVDTTNGQDCSAAIGNANLTAGGTAPNLGYKPISSSQQGRGVLGWTTKTMAACLFQPLYYYRNDDPLRAGAALLLKKDAAKIGFKPNFVGIAGSEASGKIYGPAESAVSGGVAIPTAVNGTSPRTVVDAWDMYTFGWSVSVNPTWAFFFFSTAEFGTQDNFVNWSNSTFDIAVNTLMYSVTSAATAETASVNVAKTLQVNLPYVVDFYNYQLNVIESTGWTGFTAIPGYGTSQVLGGSYSLYNVYETCSPTDSTANNGACKLGTLQYPNTDASLGYGGTLYWAMHSPNDPSGLNPMYNTNWIWQADAWGNIYDAPLATCPTQTAGPNQFCSWMLAASGSFPGWSNATYSGAGATGTGAGWYNFQDASGNTKYGVASKTEPLYNYQTVTFNFRQNLTFSDGFPLTAYTYNFSLFAWNAADNPSTPDLYTPNFYALGGPNGLIATHVVNSTEIVMYINSSSWWNVGLADLGVLPQHIFQYINLDESATGSSAIDTTLPYTQAVLSANGCAVATCAIGTAPTWLLAEPNLEIGSGPFYLTSYDSTGGASGKMTANGAWDRAQWKVNATDNIFPTSTTSILLGAQPSYGPRPWSLTTVGISPVKLFCLASYSGGGDTCPSNGYLGITSSHITSANAYVYLNGAGAPVITQALTTTGAPQLTGSLDVRALAAGMYEVVVKVTYTAFGSPTRTWYEFTGFTLGTPYTPSLTLARGTYTARTGVWTPSGSGTALKVTGSGFTPNVGIATVTAGTKTAGSVSGAPVCVRTAKPAGQITSWPTGGFVCYIKAPTAGTVIKVTATDGSTANTASP